MTYNVGDIMFQIIKMLVSFTQKLAEVVNKKFTLSFLVDLGNIIRGWFGSEVTDLVYTGPEFTLLEVLAVIGVGTYLGVLIYHMFKE